MAIRLSCLTHPCLLRGRIKGFSLLEVALGLLLMSLLLSAVLPPLSAHIRNQHYQQTATTLQLAQQALIGHALIMHYLPCPDSDWPPDGWENVRSTQDCESDEGWLPGAQLGVVATDAWGRWLRYRADATFTHHTHWFTISDAEGMSNIEVKDAVGSLTSTDSRPIAILLSHGENGLGGIQSVSGGSAYRLPLPTQPDELENADADLAFVDVPQQQRSDAVYDDQVLMLSPKVLIAQMVQAQRLP